MVLNERFHGVNLNGNRVGVLHHIGDVCRFVFVEEYWEDPSREVLGLWFEDKPNSSLKSSLRLPFWFSNLLPEGPLRKWIAADRGVSAAREVELLLQVGGDLPGAVELIPDGASPPNLTETKPAETNAKDLLVPAAWKFSLAGVGLKFSMLRDGERLTIPGKNQLGNWIVKLPDAVHPIVTINEFAMMSAAKEVGIDVPAVRLVDRSELPDLPDSVWPNGESTAYAVARFDRSPDGGRIHIEDFSQIRGFYPQDKYSGSFETVGALSYRNRDVDSLVEYVRRMTFNMLIGNGDAHLKNWSMIYEDGRTAKLSPAYDLVSTAPYVRWPDVEDLGLKFGRNRQFSRVSWKNFADLESKIGAKGSNLTGVVEDTVLRFDAVLSSALLDEWKGSIFYDWIIQNFDTMSQQLLR